MGREPDAGLGDGASDLRGLIQALDKKRADPGLALGRAAADAHSLG
jgi:hypothetical protein